MEGVIAVVTMWVYIMASVSRAIYVGYTRDLHRRIWEHKTHFRDGFTKKYKVTNLVFMAEFDRYDDAIAWERSLKGKSRVKKIALTEEKNPRWNDLAWNWYGEAELSNGRAPHGNPHG